MSNWTRCLYGDCKKRSTRICVSCYNSFCDEHIDHEHFTNPNSFTPSSQATVGQKG